MGGAGSDTRTDDELVAAALDGDRAAFGAIYDRYAGTVFGVCSQMLSSRDDAEDVTADVFLVAAERLGQLRDPSRLRYWLLSIARRNVYRRSSARSRVAVVAEVDTVSDALVTEDRSGASLEDADLVGAVRDAADGLDDGDRLVLELTLQGCEGADLAEVMGVAPNTASQAASRMRSRLERSLGALFVARQGRADCADLDAVLADWDGAFSVLWRKRVARHVDGCGTCEGRARRVPALLLEGLAGAAPAVVVPVGIRHRVVDGARVGGTTHAPWSESGFPPADAPARSWRRAAAVVGGLAVAVLVVLFSLAVAGGDDEPTTTSTSAPPTTLPATTTTAATPDVPVAPAVPGGPVGPSSTSVVEVPGDPGSSTTDGGSDPGGGGVGTAPPPAGDPDNGGSGGGGDPATGGTETAPPTPPTRPEPPVTTAPPATGGGGYIGPRPPRFTVPTLPAGLDPGRGGGTGIIP
jgi:RNA polymerase sigma factor (sigma-70 family)